MKTDLEIVRGDITTRAIVSEECFRWSGIERVLFVCHSRHDTDVYAAALAAQGIGAAAPPGQS